MDPHAKYHLKCAACSGQILGAFYDVYNRVGPGFAEALYERELARELRRRGWVVTSQRSVTVRYGRWKRQQFRPDLLVDGQVVVEIKSRSRILKSHWAQLLNYLRVAGIEVGLILNFGPSPTFKRLVYTKKGEAAADH